MSDAKDRKPKKMTNREKAERAKARKELRAEGILPPPKKPLNRKRFCAEAQEILQSGILYDLYPYLCWALLEMLGHTEYPAGTRSKEAVGAAKVLKLAKGRMDFENARRERGEPSEYKLGELFDAVKDIYEA